MSQARSLAAQNQTTHRVIRVGQRSPVDVFRLKVKNTIHGYRESKQVEKILPQLWSRIGDNQRHILLSLLQLEQAKIDHIHETEVGKKLIQDRHLLVDASSDPLDGENEEDDEDADDPARSAKKRRLASGLPAPTHKNDDLPEAVKATAENLDLPGLRGWIDTGRPAPGDGFLAPKTRAEYAAEFSELPDPTRLLFSHEKNMLRRLLSVEKCREWGAQDLKDPLVLERALELLLQAGLGSRGLEMRPSPLADLNGLDEQRLNQIQTRLAKSDINMENFTVMAKRTGNSYTGRRYNVDATVLEIEMQMDQEVGLVEGVVYTDPLN